jgi:hypothetical protein
MRSGTPYHTTILSLVCVALLLAACSPASAGINIVQLARLEHTTKIEIFELATEAGPDPYFLKLTIEEAATIERIVDALDTGMEITPKVFCIPYYELVFHLDDGSQQTFGYTCETAGTSFLRGDQVFLENEDYATPESFDRIIQELL